MKKIIFLFSLLILKLWFSTSQLLGMEPHEPGYIIKYNDVTIINNSFYCLLVFNCNEDDMVVSETYIDAYGGKIFINFVHHYSILPILVGNGTPARIENIVTAPILTISSKPENGIDFVEGHNQDEMIVFSQPIEEEIKDPTEEYDHPADNPDYQSDDEEAPNLVTLPEEEPSSNEESEQENENPEEDTKSDSSSTSSDEE